jgi:transposase
MEKKNKEPTIKILSGQEKELLRLVRAHNTPRKIALRAGIILAAARGENNHAISRELQTSRPTVILWEQRFREKGLDGLADIPKPPRASRVGEEKVKQVIAATLARPENATHWSTRTLAKKMGVSHMTVQRIWKKANLQPHLYLQFECKQRSLLMLSRSTSQSIHGESIQDESITKTRRHSSGLVLRTRSEGQRRQNRY